MHFIASQFISQEEIEELRGIFEKLDENKDGKLSKEELIQVYSEFDEALPIDMEKIIDECDIDGNGFIDYSEFLTATLNWQNCLSKDRLKAAFKSYDLDGNGKISVNELSLAFKGTGIGSEMILEAVSQVDKNNDGEIDFEEFEEFIKRPSNRC